MTPNLEQQIALLRARYTAKSAPERARGLLIAAGIPWRLAGGFVLDARRRGRTTGKTP
jgi:hypothetical protein